MIGKEFSLRIGSVFAGAGVRGDYVGVMFPTSLRWRWGACLEGIRMFDEGGILIWNAHELESEVLGTETVWRR